MNLNTVRVSLKFKLIALIITIIIVTLMTQGSITINLTEQALSAAVNEKLISITNDVSHQITAANEKEFTALRVLANVDDVASDDVPLAEKSKFLSDAAAKMGHKYENIGYYDREGNSITFDGRKINMSKRKYFQEGINGREVIIEPSYSEVMGGEMMNYGVPVRNSKGNIIGTITMILRGNPLMDLIKSIDIGGGMHPAIMNRATGETFANANEETKVEGSNIKDLDKNSELGSVLSKVMNGQSGTEIFNDPYLKIKIISAFQPIEGTTWSVFCAAPYDFYFGRLKHLKIIVTVILAASILVSVIVCGLLVSMLIKPLKNVRNEIVEIASGNADLTKRLPDATNDEIGDVVLGFNKFIEMLQSIMRNIKNSQNNLSQVDEDLQATTQDASSCIIEISANIEHVNSQIAEQINSVTETAGAVNQIASNIESLENMIEKQSDGVSQASTAVEEMIGNINSVNNAVEKMVHSFTTLENNTTSGINIQANANEKIMQIENQSKMLQDANMAIANIAEQTNLLAMNAAIEAAHAGEAGKGFSVVADEIRKLSETSSSQSRTIGEELKKIQESIESVVKASSDTTAAFNSVSNSINDTSMIIQQIKGAMEEQQIGSKQIIEVLQTMNNSTAEVKAAGAEMSAGNRQILNEINRLQTTSDIMKSSMTEMSAGAKKMNETGSALSDISGTVNETIQEISKEIDQFKI